MNFYLFNDVGWQRYGPARAAKTSKAVLKHDLLLGIVTINFEHYWWKDSKRARDTWTYTNCTKNKIIYGN